MLIRDKPSSYEIDQNNRQHHFFKDKISINSDSNVLEIGAHSGAFLSHLYDIYNCNCYYHELSTEACALLEKKVGLLTITNDLHL